MTMSANDKKVAKVVIPSVAAVALLAVFLLSWNSMFFSAEPGYMYHVTTYTGTESVVNTPGISWYGNGSVTPWKNSMTVKASDDDKGSSTAITPLRVMFLDQVDAKAEATVRFAIPREAPSGTGKTYNEGAFLRMAHEYRTPENLMATALIPAFKETLQANASLMNAEEFYAGGRSQFNAEFENQMINGTYLVKRSEKEVPVKTGNRSANASKGKQEKKEQQFQTIFVIDKVKDAEGNLIRKTQVFRDFQITVTSALVTEVTPNVKFVKRMELKQKASADRAIAREQRVQEEEQKLLVIARGARQVAEREASAMQEQIQKTTEAETTKQLALTAATRIKEEAEIKKGTAIINLAIAKTNAKAKKVSADATAYQKRVVLKADNALAQKLAAEIKIQQVWAAAFAKRAVPTTVMGGTGSSGGGDGDAAAFMNILTIDAAKRLAYDRSVGK